MQLQYKSPFPGFDPYLQRRWESYHFAFIAGLQDALRGRLPDGLKARVETRVFVETTTEESTTQKRKTKPDVMVVEFPESYPKPGYSEEGSYVVREDAEPAVAEPVTITVLEEEIKERFIQIVDLKDQDRVITTIEVLSLSNKSPGGGREEFMSAAYDRGECARDSTTTWSPNHPCRPRTRRGLTNYLKPKDFARSP